MDRPFCTFASIYSPCNIVNRGFFGLWAKKRTGHLRVKKTRPSRNSSAIDITMQHAIKDIGTSTNNATTTTEAAVRHFLDYAHCNPNAELIFWGSDMILQTDSDAAYLVMPNAQSRAGGYHFLGSKDRTLFNAAFYVLAWVIKNVMGSAMEAEIAAMYENAQKIIKFRQTLSDMGHPQPPTLIWTDNHTACGIVNGTMKQERSKAIYMRYHWIKQRTNEANKFVIKWAPGIYNLANYPTKHHPASHHRIVQPIFLLIKGKSPTTMKGCNKILAGE